MQNWHADPALYVCRTINFQTENPMDTPHTCVEGNRLPVPAAVPNKHFLYKTAPVLLPPDATKLVVDEVDRFVCNKGLYPGEVELVERYDLDEPANKALDELMASLPAALQSDKPALLVCEQALPHTDPTYQGSAFVSVVLATGPEPYHLQCFHSTLVDGLPDLVTSSRVLRVGDCVVFDPTTPHMVVPLHPHQEQLLVLLQVELEDKTESERARILEQLPPVADDRDIVDLSFIM